METSNIPGRFASPGSLTFICEVQSAVAAEAIDEGLGLKVKAPL